MRFPVYLLCAVVLIGCDDAERGRDAPAGMVPGASSNLTEDVAALQATASGGDVAGVYAMMPEQAVASEARDALGEANADLVSFFKSMRLDEPRPIVIASDGAGSVVRFEATLFKKGRPVGRVVSAMVAVSVDDGASWRFLHIDRPAAKSYLTREYPALDEAITPSIPKFRTRGIE